MHLHGYYTYQHRLLLSHGKEQQFIESLLHTRRRKQSSCWYNRLTFHVCGQLQLTIHRHSRFPSHQVNQPLISVLMDDLSFQFVFIPCYFASVQISLNLLVFFDKFIVLTLLSQIYGNLFRYLNEIHKLEIFSDQSHNRTS